MIAVAPTPVDEIVVEITARLDLLESQLGSAEKRVDESARRMDRSTSRVGGGFEGITKHLATGVVRMGGLIAGARALEGSLKALTAFSGTFSADADQALESYIAMRGAISSIPIIGQAFAAGGGLREALIEAALANKQIQQVGPLTGDVEETRHFRTNEIIQSLKAETRRLELRGLMAGASPGERARLEALGQSEELMRLRHQMETQLELLSSEAEAPFLTPSQMEVLEKLRTTGESAFAAEQAAKLKKEIGRPLTPFAAETAIGAAKFSSMVGPAASTDPPKENTQKKIEQNTGEQVSVLNEIRDAVGALGFG